MPTRLDRSVVVSIAAVPLFAVTHALPAQRTAPARPPASTSYVSETSAPGRFALVAAGTSAPIVTSSGDLPGVSRVAGDLRTDIGRVSGVQPSIFSDSAPGARTLVLLGTLGHHPLIDRLVRERRVDTNGIAGRWETFLLQVVDRPFPGVDRALVIAGSDRRGTIYGAYDLSSEIGVSPWYWWADVPPRKRSALFVDAGRHTRGEPAVRYRGIFLNDEAPALSGWARMTFGGFNHHFYERVFELLLRLKGNYLWPAMWGNAFADDDSASARLANEYGVVMGTSHHEPMTRAQAEWRRYGKGAWNYEQNDSVLRAFWRDGIRRMDGRENIVTIGMRGDGDMPMTEGSNIALLERIVADQRRIIADVTGKEPARTPQLWALYKEVQDYYDKGMRVPDDVTLLFADDNWGNIRRLPSRAESARSGGFGVYYHFDYVGGPRNYKWLNTNPLPRVWEQMHLAWRYGADRIWIVNVGDLKPMEYPISFFLDYAWNPSRWPADSLPVYATHWSAQQFGLANADTIADLNTTYLFQAGRRKPELIDADTYTLDAWNEAETITKQWDLLEQRALDMRERLPAELHDAYAQLVLYPIQAQANLQRMYYAVARNRRYARQLRAATNLMADSARSYFERDAALTRAFHTEVAAGKWNHMMDQTHIGYTYWQEPPRNAMPRVDVIQVPASADMGVWFEGMPAPRPGPPANAAPVTLPVFGPFVRDSAAIEIYNRGATPFDYAVSSNVPWVRVEPATGTVALQSRLSVRVDWRSAPTGKTNAPITITRAGAPPVVITAVVDRPAAPRIDEVDGFVEGDGYVAMEGEHFTRAIATAPLAWLRIPGLGRTLSGMTITPVTTESLAVQPGAARGARLEYRAYLATAGPLRLRSYISPSLNFTGRREGLRFAVSIDDETPQVVNVLADSSDRAWEASVAANIRILTTTHEIAEAGWHVVKFWAVDPGVVLQRLVVESRELPPSRLGPPESFHRRGTSPPARH